MDHSLHECVRAAIVQLLVFDSRTGTGEAVRADDKISFMASTFWVWRSGL
jgi:hypothetical protein